LLHLARAVESGESLPLNRLVGLDWETFVAADRRREHYRQAGLFIRFLLNEADPARREALRAFLRGVSAGQPATGEALRVQLKSEWPAIEAQFRIWLERESARVRRSVP